MKQVFLIFFFFTFACLVNAQDLREAAQKSCNCASEANKKLEAADKNIPRYTLLMLENKKFADKFVKDLSEEEQKSLLKAIQTDYADILQEFSTCLKSVTAGKFTDSQKAEFLEILSKETDVCRMSYFIYKTAWKK